MKRNRPALRPFGARPTVLDDSLLGTATPVQRIESVWPYVTQRILSFERSLNARQQANFDAEDVCQELVCKLLEKNDLFDPERGKYVTFAAAVLERMLVDLRDRSSTIEAPKDASGRVKAYRQREASGTLTDRCRQTRADITRTKIGGCGLEQLRLNTTTDPSPDQTVAEAESLARTRQALHQVIAVALKPTEARVLGRLMGLGGQDPVSPFWLAWEMRKTREEITRIKDRAIMKIRRHLQTVDHSILTDFSF